MGHLAARAPDPNLSSRTCRYPGSCRPHLAHGGRTDGLEIYPGLRAGVGLVRGGAGTALVGSHTEVADLIEEYHRIDEFILSGHPHLEEAYRFGEGVLPILRHRALWKHPAQPSTVAATVPFAAAAH